MRFAILAVCSLSAFAGDWNPKLAAEYLDARQKAWLEWPTAKAAGDCMSCHTQLTYLLARPMLRSALRESQPTPYETALLDNVAKHVEKGAGATPTAGHAVDAVLSAVLVGGDQATKQMWALQIAEGEKKGAFPWYSLDLDPWETTASPFFGASLAALAVGSEKTEKSAALVSYLQKEYENQPLHNRLAMLWASTKMPALLSDTSRKSLIKEVWSKQQADGGWTLESLGPFKQHADAPEQSTGSNNYATAYAAFVLSKVDASNPKMKQALGYLRAHQDTKTGAWPALSMNKHYPSDSMEIKFMQDAATGFAVMALLGSGSI